MASRPDTDDYLSLFLNDVPLMDVRAPVEFSRGSFPNTENAPLMNDEERHRVGICYKEKGQDKAIELGHQLVSGDIKAQRIEAWKRFVARHPEGYLFCFRGGLRSRLTQEWIRDAGIDYPLVKGGYKALRRFLIDSLEAQVKSGEFRILSGRTGTGKTRVLQQLPNPVDLEGLANHRGSSFGRQVTPNLHRSISKTGWPWPCSRPTTSRAARSTWKMRAGWWGDAPCPNPLKTAWRSRHY